MATPRIRHLRHRRFARDRYGRDVPFFAQQAIRLSASATSFETTGFDTGTDTVTVPGHSFDQGDGPFTFSSTGDLPGGIDADGLYFIGQISGDDFGLYLSPRDARDDNNRVAISSVGSGTRSIARTVTAAALFEKMRIHGIPAEAVASVPDIDDLEG